MQRPSQSSVQCPLHKELYTNFCINTKCLAPLCPECITSHTSGNHGAQITSVRECSQICTNKLKVLLDHLQRLTQHPELQTACNLESLLNQQSLNLGILKEKLIYKVETYFNQLIVLMKAEIIKISKNPFITELYQKLTDISSQLSQLTRQANTPDRGQLEAFRTILTLDDELLMQRTNIETIKVLEDIRYPQIQVIGNVEEKWDQTMKEFISIDTDPPLKSNPVSHIKLSSVKHNSTVKKTDFFVKQCFNRCLHYFKFNSNELFICNLGTCSFEKVQLKNQFKTPVFHCSVINPNGLIYLLGGTLPNSQYPKQKSEVIYQYEWGKQTLKKVGTMVQARSSFGCCIRGQYVYSIAGLGDNAQEIQTCERQIIVRISHRFDTVTGKSQSITDCLYPAVGPACVELGSYIYKISEHHIERFSIDDGLWQQIDPNVIVHSTPFNGLCQYSCAFSISNTEILIVGGYQQDKGTSSVYMLDQPNDSNPNLFVLENTLPFAEGFWSQQAIVHQKGVFLLQNIEQKGNEVTSDSRRILCYNGDWQALN